MLLVIPSLGAGGAERVTATLANHWARQGWDITIVTLAGAERDFYTLDEAVRRIALDMAVQSRHAVQGLINNVRRIAALRRILRRERPTVAVGMMTTANAILALAGRLAGIPTVGEEHIHPPAFPLGRLWESARGRTYPLLHAVVALTGDSAAWLRERAPAPRIVVIPNPVEYPLPAHPPSVPPAHLFASLPGSRVLLAVGRLEAQKGFDRLIIAFAKVAQRHPDWSLVILGRGNLHEALIWQAAELGIGERIALPGAVGNMGEWYEAADLYALTSRFEGFGNTLVEALAYGLPVVAVDCQTGPREIVRHGVDGLLVPQDDPAALAAALDRMMGDKSRRERFSARAIEARDRFAISKIAKEWESLFASVISPAPSER